MQYTIEDMQRAGCTSDRGIRFWEDSGLLLNVERTAGGHRRYTENHIKRAKIIAAAKFGGWELNEIKEMLATYDSDVQVYNALMYRLKEQLIAATNLARALPMPPGIDPETGEYDL